VLVVGSGSSSPQAAGTCPLRWVLVYLCPELAAAVARRVAVGERLTRRGWRPCSWAKAAVVG
jgi:hypothetical protein